MREGRGKLHFFTMLNQPFNFICNKRMSIEKLKVSHKLGECKETLEHLNDCLSARFIFVGDLRTLIRLIMMFFVISMAI